MRNHWPHYKIEHLYYFSFGSLKKALQENHFEHIRKKTAYKALTLDYVNAIFRIYRQPFFSTASSLLRHITPARLANRPIWTPSGDMTIIAQADSADPSGP